MSPNSCAPSPFELQVARNDRVAKADFRKQFNELLVEAYRIGAVPHDGDCVVFIEWDRTRRDDARPARPHGVVCLLSALRFHGLTTQAPFEVWLAIDRKGWAPKPSSPPLRIVRMSGKPLTAGVEKRTVEGVEIQVFSKSKTVADCFRYRNKVGIDVALEALRDFLRGKGKIDELMRFADVDHVARVIRPYLEALA